jgi:hypothetical protein
MKNTEVLDYIKQVWKENPLSVVVPGIAVSTVDGIQQQLDAKSALVLYTIMENDNTVIKTVKVEYD